MADIHYTNVRIFDGGGEAPFMGEVLVQGDRIARVVKTGQGMRSRADRRRPGGRRRRRLPDAGHGRGPHPLLLERPADARRDPAHAARGAHPLVRRGGQALPRHGLDQLRRRRRRQAAARRRHQERDRGRHHRRPALPRRQPGDHGARRPRRHDPAAPAAARLRVRRDRQRRRGDAPLRAHVRQVRRRLAEDQPLGRIDHRHAERPLPVHRRRDRHLRRGGQGLGQAGRRACPLLQLDQAVRAATASR